MHRARKIDGFQSTCLREARPAGGSQTIGGLHFNPRAYVRHDLQGEAQRAALLISIHVPT